MATEEVKTEIEVAAEIPEEKGRPTQSDTLYIWGLNKETSQREVKDVFERFAKIVRVTIIKDKGTQISKGFGYVLCTSADEAAKGLKEMDGRIIGDNPIHVKFSFSGTPDWMKFLDTKGGDERERGRGRGRGRGHFGGRGRGDRGGRGGRGGYQHREQYDSYSHSNDRRPRHDENEEFRRRPPMRDEGFRQRDERQPTREDLLYSRDNYAPGGGSSRDAIYAPVEKRDVYEDRRDLYRPSDNQRFQDPLIRREDYLGDRSTEALSRAPVDHRARSPIRRPAPERDFYESPVQSRPVREHVDVLRYPPTARAEAERYPPARAEAERYPPAHTEAERYPPARTEAERYPPARTEAERYAPARVEADRYAPARVEADRYAPARVEADRYAPARVEADRYAPARVEADRYPPARVEGDRYAPARVEVERYPPGRSEAERYPPPQHADTERYPPQYSEATRYPQAHHGGSVRDERAPVDYRAQYREASGHSSYEENRSIVGKINDPYAQIGPS